jgi:hypothetical protein
MCANEIVNNLERQILVRIWMTLKIHVTPNL